MRLIVCLGFLSLATLVGCARPSAKPAHEKRRVVIMVSIDGLHPDNYLSPAQAQDAPVLHELAREGFAAEAVIPVYPSVTFPNHASLATGVRPARHGVVSNTVFDPVHGLTVDWYFDSSVLKVPALWDAAREAKLKTAVFGWPVSLNAKVDWLVPEVFSPYTLDHGENWKYTLKHTDPALMQELWSHSSGKPISSNEEYDDWMVGSALYVLKQYHPDLLLLHLRSLDSAQHEGGRSGPSARAALRFVDFLIGKFVGAVDLRESILVIVGDHGFTDATREIRINSLFAEKGWLKTKGKEILSWKVLAQSNGGQALIYLKNPDDSGFRKQVLAFLSEKAPGHFRMIDRKQLDALGAAPSALCALDPEGSFSFSRSFEGPWIHPLKGVHGEHGALPNNPQLQTGFIASGDSLEAGRIIKEMQIIDVAPTVAHLLGLSLPSAEGIPLNLTHSPAGR